MTSAAGATSARLDGAAEELKRWRLSDVVHLGFDLYGGIRKRSDEETPDGDPSSIAIFEEDLCQQWKEYAGRFELQSPEGLYVRRITQVAASFANSIGSARRVLERGRAEAEASRHKAQEREYVLIGRQAMGRFGVQLLLIGGLFGVLTFLALGVSQVASGPTQILMALVTAFASMILGMSRQLKDIARTQRRIDGAFLRRIDNAKEVQCDRVELEMKSAQLEFAAAYLEMFEEEPEERVTSLGLQLDIMGLMRDQTDKLYDELPELSITEAFRALWRALVSHAPA